MYMYMWAFNLYTCYMKFVYSATSSGLIDARLLLLTWETINTGPGTWGLGTQGLVTQGPRARDQPRILSLVLRVVLHCRRYSGAINSMGNQLQAQTHGYVLYVVTVHFESIIHSKSLFSDLFDAQSNLLSVLQTCTHKVRKAYIHIDQSRLSCDDRWPLNLMLIAYSMQLIRRVFLKWRRLIKEASNVK